MNDGVSPLMNSLDPEITRHGREFDVEGPVRALADGEAPLCVLADDGVPVRALPDLGVSVHVVVDDESSTRAAVMDQHVGARIRERRTMLGISQQQLAQTIGVTYQQAHKYERGLNRISAGRLYEIAIALGVAVNWFFEGMVEANIPPELTARQRMCLELARNFAAIDNSKHQEALSHLARALAVQAVSDS